MKRLLSIILVLTLMLIPVNANAAVKPVNKGNSSKYDANTESLSISQTSAMLYVGDRLSLQIIGISNRVSWKTDNKNVAAVSKQGKISGVGIGTANITATVSIPGGVKKLNCQVTVQSRLGASIKNVLCSEGELQEIGLYGYNLKDNESLFYEVEDEDIASVESIDTDNVLKIIPEKLGATKIYIYVGKDIDNINYNDKLEINILVTDDKEWITPEQMICLLGNNYLETLYGQYFDKSVPEYNGYEIETKILDNFYIYYNAEDLRDAGIL